MKPGAVLAVLSQLTHVLCPDMVERILDTICALSIQKAWRAHCSFKQQLPPGWKIQHNITEEQFGHFQHYGFWGGFVLAFRLPCAGWCLAATLAKRGNNLVMRYTPDRWPSSSAQVAAAARQLRLYFESYGITGTWLLLYPAENATAMDLTRFGVYSLNLPLDCFSYRDSH